ncbi:uncharacterized protein LOC18433644 isoform X1 [Amborella trichopoda]|uniref:uncharacterized protein LOC18433644 isoform X1 n=1 Tax=Amborella trichopoda TaxID=13333 RepID=UPI0009BF444E|nr:uncharacterized protein LOC18433644 isoform X1 [Amborella trichopoda]XP_020522359.1 uncharacterized protein LOC18433644 isoform X1 [Amborella trichopoda]|eukprot:XP_020522358.1 uncharacterized protein LOC18433644 isoform X1 [Amborella trichopoda]
MQSCTLNLPPFPHHPSLVASSLFFEPTSRSFAVMSSDSSILLFPLLPLSLPSLSTNSHSLSSSLPSLSAPSCVSIPPPCSSACFIRIHGHGRNPRVLFLCTSPAKSGSRTLLRAWILKENSTFTRAHLCFKDTRSNSGISLDLPHGFGVQLSGSVNVFSLHSPSSAKIWVMASKPVAETERMNVVKCAVIDCNSPVYSIRVFVQYLLLGEEDGVRVFTLKNLVKGKVVKKVVSDKVRVSNDGPHRSCRNLSNGIFENGQKDGGAISESFTMKFGDDSLKDCSGNVGSKRNLRNGLIKGLDDNEGIRDTDRYRHPNATSYNGKLIGPTGPVSEDNGFIRVSNYGVSDGQFVCESKNLLKRGGASFISMDNFLPTSNQGMKVSSEPDPVPVEIRTTLKLRQDSGEHGSYFVSFKGSDCHGSKCNNPSSASLRVISIHALAHKRFLILDSFGDLHLLNLHGNPSGSETIDVASNQSFMKRMDCSMNVQMFGAFSDVSARPRTIWISDGCHSLHVMALIENEIEASSTELGEVASKENIFQLSGKMYHNLMEHVIQQYSRVKKFRRLFLSLEMQHWFLAKVAFLPILFLEVNVALSSMVKVLV